VNAKEKPTDVAKRFHRPKMKERKERERARVDLVNEEKRERKRGRVE
jgi:hypothetical protein